MHRRLNIQPSCVLILRKFWQRYRHGAGSLLTRFLGYTPLDCQDKHISVASHQHVVVLIGFVVAHRRAVVIRSILPNLSCLTILLSNQHQNKNGRDGQNISLSLMQTTISSLLVTRSGPWR